MSLTVYIRSTCRYSSTEMSVRQIKMLGRQPRFEDEASRSHPNIHVGRLGSSCLHHDQSTVGL